MIRYDGINCAIEVFPRSEMVMSVESRVRKSQWVRKGWSVLTSHITWKTQKNFKCPKSKPETNPLEFWANNPFIISHLNLFLNLSLHYFSSTTSKNQQQKLEKLIKEKTNSQINCDDLRIIFLLYFFTINFRECFCYFNFY